MRSFRLGFGLGSGRGGGSSFDGMRPRSLRLQPLVGNPALGQTHALSPAGIGLAPSVGSPTLGQAGVLAPESVTLVPSVGSPAIGQIHTLTASGISVTPSVGTPTLTSGVSAAVISSVTVGALSSGDLPLSITATGAADGVDTVYWVIVGTGDTAPIAQEVRDGEESGGGAPLDSGNFTWDETSVPDQAITSGIDENVDIYVVIDNGALSNVGTDTNFEVDTTLPALSSPVGTQTGATTATWGVTSNEAQGTIYAGVRPSASAALTAAQLIAGSGGAGVDFDSDASPTADSSNGGSFSGLTASTGYDVDIVQVDEFGNESTVVSSAEFTTAAGGGATIASIIAAEGGVYFDTGDTSTMWQDIGAATTAVTVATDPVGHMTAAEGSTTAGAPNTGDRRTWDGAELLENPTDGDDQIRVVLDAALQNADMFVAFILDPANTGESVAICLAGDASEFVGLGDATTSGHTNTGDTIIYRKDGVDQSISDRQDVLNTYGSGSPMVASFTGLSTVGWTEIGIGIYPGNDAFRFNGKVGHIVIIPGGTSLANQAAIEAELGVIVGTITDA